MTQQIENFATRIEQGVSQLSLPLVDGIKNIRADAAAIFNWLKIFAIFLVIALIIIVILLFLILRKPTPQ